MRRRQKAEAQLQESNRQLSAGLAELKDRSRQIAQLSEMVHMLQSSADIAEALEIISLYAARLLPGEGGALYLFNASRNALEARANWGSFSIKGEEHLFEQKECWGLRLGQAYTVTDPAHEMVCLHIGAHRRPYRCIPLFGQGEALGVLHIESDPAHASPPQDDIAAAAAEQIALTLANLRLRETLRTQSIRDLLTGLYNRRYLEETFERELLRVKRKKASLAVFLFDVDHFKRFNDTFGHDAGDVVLHEVGRLLRVHTREADLACRYGGEEFVCVLPETPPTIAQARAEVLREAVAALQVTHLGQHLGPISISIGVAIYPEHGTSMEELLRAADESLYAAKQQGRNRVVIAETTGTTMSISTSLPSEPA
jgi:diguanylate cyclase (GGDEF)-like protein